jgi:hypothetical protein
MTLVFVLSEDFGYFLSYLVLAGLVLAPIFMIFLYFIRLIPPPSRLLNIGCVNGHLLLPSYQGGSGNYFTLELGRIESIQYEYRMIPPRGVNPMSKENEWCIVLHMRNFSTHRVKRRWFDTSADYFKFRDLLEKSVLEKKPTDYPVHPFLPEEMA